MEIEKVKQANSETQPNVKMSIVKLWLTFKVQILRFLSYGKVRLARWQLLRFYP